jgi:acyl-CoA thioester hydrolase
MNFETLPITYRAAIPESYLDEMGHMNVMWYTHLFSEATGGFFDLFGMNRQYFETNNAGSFALEVHVRYRAEVRAGQQVHVRTRALGRSARRYHFMHFLILDHTDALSSTGEFVGTHVDMATRRSSPMPPAIAEAFDRLLAEHAGLPWEAPVCGIMKP